MLGRSQFVGSAGQYYVAYAMTVRGFHAAITLGNVPHVDLVVGKPDGSRLLSVQVKTARNAYRANRYGYKMREWDVGGSAVGHSSEGLWYALLDLQEADEEQWSPILYFVPSLWVSSMVKHDWSRKMYMLRSDLWKDCEERWDRIRGYLETDLNTMTWCRTVPTASLWPPAEATAGA